MINFTFGKLQEQENKSNGAVNDTKSSCIGCGHATYLHWLYTDLHVEQTQDRQPYVSGKSIQS